MQDKYTGLHFLAANFYQTRCFKLLKLVTREFKNDSGNYGILLIKKSSTLIRRRMNKEKFPGSDSRPNNWF